MPLHLNLQSSTNSTTQPSLLERLRPLAASGVNRAYYGTERHYLQTKHRLYAFFSSLVKIDSPTKSNMATGTITANIPTQHHSASGITIYTMYPPTNPPPHPGAEWTRFVCLSDTHSRVFDVPYGDVLLHSGDLSSLGRVPELKVTMDWLCALPHPQKVVIAGNHDLSLDREWYERTWTSFHKTKENFNDSARLMKNDAAGLIYLEYGQTTIQAKYGGRKWKIYGSPGSPWFGGWAYNYERGDEAAAFHANIPNDTDILLTHGPPFEILDMTNRSDHVGCKELSTRIAEIRPLLNVFGHIHEDRGVEIKEWNEDAEMETGIPSRNLDHARTIFVNAANSPSGAKGNAILRAGITNGRLWTGCPGFQPIIVDLYDPVERAGTSSSS